MEYNPGEANRPSASEGIPHTLRNPKAYYQISKSPLPVTILIQINAVHAPTIPLL
jgi:hypothetical protein